MQPINFSEVKEAKAAGLQCGKYLAIYHEVKEKKSSKNTDMFECDLKIMAGKHKGKIIKDYLVFKGKDENATKKLLGKVKKIYKSIHGEEKANSKFTPKTEDLLGQMIMIDVVPKLNEFTGDDGILRKSYQAKIDFAGYFPADDYMEIMDSELFDCPIYKQEETTQQNNTVPQGDELIGENEIPF